MNLIIIGLKLETPPTEDQETHQLLSLPFYIFPILLMINLVVFIVVRDEL